ncbi:hypothetical protein [Chitinophaga pinensis]|uniref:Uncharacterized protein n=1 Tax=Chitinophaga pinensis (strain ATCC 43595 / DSM 2588 / LMG 13176 / NBRC 15968 / NCIMB 11800 / UQM 2034) TaxID=485918 RepID=A0A979G8B9_CHIPD|nr:hypothetical protein [Chitinophaga pinensis]ACU62636.1 hypothetical protein Cpin_5205 [Chitinophaga pinensis DSM 2588]
MRTILIILFLLNTVWGSLRAQTAELAEIGVEGATLFSSELASWYGTDLALEKYPKLRDELGGYVTTMHTHLPETGFFITATDICTFRLCEKFAGWKEHVVVSQTDVSIWNCAHDILVGRPRNEWEKEGQHNEESH